jgi:PAS domain S-box-containing protein
MRAHQPAKITERVLVQGDGLSGPDASDPRFQGLLEAAPDAIVCVDADGTIVLVNGQTERLFGYGRSELIGERVELLVPDIARRVHPSHRETYVADPKRRPMGAGMELAGRRKDGGEFPAEISLSALRTGDALLVVAAVRDVSDRKRAEAKFRGLLQAAPDAIVGVGSDGRISLVNAQAERLFGYARDELIGQALEILVPETARDFHSEHRSTYFAHPVPRPMGAGMQLAARRKDGTTFPAEISLSAIETEEGLLVSAAIRDVTERIEEQAERERLRAQAERERLERQLHQSQRLESLGQLAGGVAHDFNNLLGVILNYASFVAQEIDNRANVRDVDWRAVSSDVAEIQRAAERATRLTHQLLAFGRREVVQPVTLTVNDVIRDMERLLTRTLGEHVELVTSLASDPWLVMADPGQLEQVLVNLAVNARDAMPGGGRLVLESQNITVDDDYVARRPELAPGRHVRLRVSDTGAGMGKDVIDRAFEPFFTTKPKGEGTGLGLATVYGIVKQAGGDVEIYSEPGFGTTISVILPATGSASPLRPEPKSSRHQGGGETVLVVEDETAMRELTRRILAKSGYHVLLAACGSDALREAQQHDGPIDLLLTDVVMPQMLGREVAERMAALRPGIRILYVSGYAQPILGSTGTLEQGVTLLEKPFTEPLLLAKVREVLDAPQPSTAQR